MPLSEKIKDTKRETTRQLGAKEPHGNKDFRHWFRASEKGWRDVDAVRYGTASGSDLPRVNWASEDLGPRTVPEEMHRP